MKGGLGASLFAFWRVGFAGENNIKARDNISIFYINWHKPTFRSKLVQIREFTSFQFNSKYVVKIIYNTLLFRKEVNKINLKIIQIFDL